MNAVLIFAEKYKLLHISAGDKLVYADNEQEKLCICELHDGTEVECKRGTKFRPFKPKSLVLDEYSNIKVRQPLYLTVVKKTNKSTFLWISAEDSIPNPKVNNKHLIRPFPFITVNLKFVSS